MSKQQESSPLGLGFPIQRVLKEEFGGIRARLNFFQVAHSRLSDDGEVKSAEEMGFSSAVLPADENATAAFKFIKAEGVLP